ncbi:MAG: hypothetical protein JKY49_03520 [Cohaesibacteraceae bacterium]|nr:hypothetical protein [Cohaesibacteraceae bacterium]MBL4876159.1 hypothetical protein [Cohaesibacteraceae bacterium]
MAHTGGVGRLRERSPEERINSTSHILKRVPRRPTGPHAIEQLERIRIRLEQRNYQILVCVVIEGRSLFELAISVASHRELISDTYNFGLGDVHDTYLGSADVNIAGADTFNFEGGISQNLLWFSRNGSNLDVKVIGSTEGITLQNWYAGTTGDGLSAHIKDFKAGSSIPGFANVNGLVNAMAGFTPEDGGITATTLPQSVQMAVSATWS